MPRCLSVASLQCLTPGVRCHVSHALQRRLQQRRHRRRHRPRPFIRHHRRPASLLRRVERCEGVITCGVELAVERRPGRPPEGRHLHICICAYARGGNLFTCICTGLQPGRRDMYGCRNRWRLPGCEWAAGWMLGATGLVTAGSGKGRVTASSPSGVRAARMSLVRSPG